MLSAHIVILTVSEVYLQRVIVLILARKEAEHYENDKGGSVLSIVCLG